ncbi:transcription termination factor Rho [Rhodococcus sp. G-MC3]|uniref:transcription termination factor Rho n=1 Tax=Rhodococcus sp. G-MC3 TaxID=3046209 RepID=UPI0024B94CE8|nr:transcription termination factor Rho [Rhodococcus sp. G-MC3]MDJ0395688.1 transcription termination factor Rho [Rhodococcus sp. G-MC3]
MTDTELISAPEKTRRGAGLSGMVLTELRSLAGELGIKSISGMRKGDLIAAISARQGATGATASETPKVTSRRGAADKARNQVAPADAPTEAVAPVAPESSVPESSAPERNADDASDAPRRTRGRRTAGRKAGAPDQLPLDETGEQPKADAAPADAAPAEASGNPAPAQDTTAEAGAAERPRRSRGDRENRGAAEGNDGNTGTRGENPDTDGNRADGGRSNRDNSNRGNRGESNRGDSNRGEGNRGENTRNDSNRGDSNRGDSNRGDSDRGEGNRNRNRNQNQNDNRSDDRNGNGPRDNRDGRDNQDDDGDGRGRRGRRFRERRRGRDRGEVGGGGTTEREPEIREDDVLQPVAGILDVLDNYAFVRTSGYLAGSNDVYVSMNLVRKNGLRRGDAITGAVRVAREGEQSNQRQKFNPLVRLDTVNGGDVEAARKRPEFGKLTPLYPNQRLRLETTPNILTTRIIDLVMPIGKGQRALIVSPPKAGKTSVLQAIANAISINNPECYLMVVLVDERPEEVTDMQRSVKGEVIASTFDRPPGDHTAVAELAIERAKRLVEAGQDVVVLLDSITRLGRAYNNSSPASGRILSGGVDSTALYPPKRFLGAARNIENGGSLTIIATAMVETGSTGDTVIFEEFKGTGNAELKLDRKIAERRVFPAVDINPSSTRHDELLLAPDEAAVVHKLRRVLSGLDSHQAIDLLVDRLKKSKSNLEFLMEVSKTAPGAMGD